MQLCPAPEVGFAFQHQHLWHHRVAFPIVRVHFELFGSSGSAALGHPLNGGRQVTTRAEELSSIVPLSNCRTIEVIVLQWKRLQEDVHLHWVDLGTLGCGTVGQYRYTNAFISEMEICPMSEYSAAGYQY